MEDIAELANVLAWDAVGAQIEPYLVQHAEWQRPCGVALGCRSLNSRGIKMLRRAAAFFDSDNGTVIRVRTYNFCTLSFLRVTAVKATAWCRVLIAQFGINFDAALSTVRPCVICMTILENMKKKSQYKCKL